MLLLPLPLLPQVVLGMQLLLSPQVLLLLGMLPLLSPPVLPLPVLPLMLLPLQEVAPVPHLKEQEMVL